MPKSKHECIKTAVTETESKPFTLKQVPSEVTRDTSISTFLTELGGQQRHPVRSYKYTEIDRKIEKWKVCGAQASAGGLQVASWFTSTAQASISAFSYNYAFLAATRCVFHALQE